MRYCVLSLFRYANKSMRKAATPLAKTPRPKKVETTEKPTSVIDLPGFEKQGSAALSSLNFRVPPAFHREFKLYAVQNGMSMVDLLQKSFILLKKQRGS